jgi:hypothetical protein
LSAAWLALTGSPGSTRGPVIVSPIFSTYGDESSGPNCAAAIALSTYALVTVCIATLVGSTWLRIAASLAGLPPGMITGITQYSRVVVPSFR